MYDITTIPVPYHMNEELIDETESKYTYTKIKPTTDILALGRSSQINLGYNDLVHCIQDNIMLFCEQMFLIKTGNEYTCENAIYTLGSWYIEANLAYCTEEPATILTLYYTVNMATIVYQFAEKIKTEGITDLTLYCQHGNNSLPICREDKD